MIMRKRAASLGGALLALGSVACEDTKSTDVATADIRLDSGHATAGHQIELFLNEGDSEQLVEIAPGDQLVATVDGVERPLPEDSIIGVPAYRSDLGENVSEVSVTLRRESGDDATISVGIAPEPTITSPSSVSKTADEAVITWSNPEPDTFVAIFVYSCADVEISTESQMKSLEEDMGTYSLAMSEVLANGDDDCATLRLLRLQEPDSTGGFHPDSEFRGRRYTDFQITLTD